MSNETAGARLWDTLAPIYSSSPHVAADWLIEWPAQLRMCGDFHGCRVLDVGCGSGEKARYFAEHGATEVVGVDPSSGFAQQWSTLPALPNLRLLKGSYEDLLSLAEVRDTRFDLILSFQSLMYAANQAQAIRAMAGLLVAGGTLVFSVPHPFRFAILRNEIEGWGLGYAYQRTAPYRYPSPWKSDIFIEQPMLRFCDHLNAVATAGLRLESVDEPPPTEELRKIAPEKAAWMDRYVGIAIFRARAEG